MKRLIAMAIILCMLFTAIGTLPFTVSAAENDLFELWDFSGQRYKGTDKLVVSAPVSGTNNAKKNFYDISSKFDVEITAAVKNFGKEASIWILSGTHRLKMFLNEGGFTYERNSSHGGGTAMVNADIGFSEHTYRFVGNGSQIDVYIDGYFIETIYVVAYSYTPRIEVNAKEGAKVIVTDIKVNEPVTAPVATSKPAEEKVEEKKAPQGFHWEFDGNDDLSDVVNLASRFQVRADEGVLYSLAPDLSFKSANYYMDDLGDDFTYETRIKLLRFGNAFGFTFAWDRIITFYMRDRFLYSNVEPGGIASEMFNFRDPNVWHDIKFETYNNGTRCRLFIDGKKVYDIEPAVNKGDKYIYFFHTGYTDPVRGTSEIMYDYMKFTPVVYPVQIDETLQGGVYMSGQPIHLSATVEEGEEIPSVDYKINGRTVATGKAPDYKASVSTIPAGKWEITAEYEDKVSGTAAFEVLRPIDGELVVEETSDSKLQLSIQDFHDEQDKVKYVEYLVDGVSVAKEDKAPFTAAVKNLTNEGHTITALLKLEGDITIQQLDANYTPQVGDGTSVSYANEVSYEVTGEDGEVTVLVSNGRHSLHMKHTKEGLTYQTIDGEESYPNGTGRFRIITDGPFVEGYYGGQFAFSFLMPRTTKVARKVTENGLAVKDFELSIPKMRNNYYVENNVPVKTVTHQIPGLGAIYNLDFIAGAGDEGEIAISDGYYCTKIIMEDGELYTWNVQEEWAEPYKFHIGSLPKEGTVYYRVDIVDGIARIHADGKWFNSFRSILSMGEPQLGINLTGGDGLEYLAINDYEDLYVHEDKFDDQGDIDSIDYWDLTTNMTAAIDADHGTMFLSTNSERAGAELMAHAGNMDFSADVKLMDLKGGFWLTFGRTYEQWYNKVGYNAETGKLELLELRSDNNKTPTITNVIAEKEGSLPIKKTFHVELKTRIKAMTKEIIFLVDGEEIFHQEINLRQNGMVGFMLTKGSASVSNVKYRGDAKPMVSLTSYGVKHGVSTADMIDIDGTLYFAAEGQTGAPYTSDGGKTWSSKGLFPTIDKAGRSAMRMSNGELISITRTKVSKDENGKDLKVNGVHISADNGASWVTLDPVQSEPNYDRDQMAGRVSQGQSGRVYYVSGEVGNENFGVSQVFYSDDFGRSWTPSETIIDGWELDFAHQEAVVHELPNGVVRVWMRNDKGFVLYVDSQDGGKTFDLDNIKMTPFATSLDTIGVDQDPDDPNVFYMTWAFDNANLRGQPMYPRTRASIAKSVDGGESWEYVGTIFELNDAKGLSSFNNTNLDVGKEYVAWNATLEGDSETSADYGSYLMFPKNKQVSSKRFERLHRINDLALEMQRMMPEDVENATLMINKKEKTVRVFGELIQDAYADDGISIDVAAAYLSATIKSEKDGGIILYQGDLAYTFGKNAIIKKNGKTYLKLDAFQKETNLMSFEEDGFLILGKNDQWSVRQIRAMRMANDLFVKEL